MVLERINFRSDAIQAMALPALVDRYNNLVQIKVKTEAQQATQDALRYEIERRTGQKAGK